MPSLGHDDDRLSLAEVGEALDQLCAGADFARALSIARGRAAGLVGWTAEDLLHETMVNLLAGNRRWPRGLHPLVVLKTAMHSIASNIRKRGKKGPVDARASAEDADQHREPEVSDQTPIDAVDAKTQLEVILKAVAGDEDAGLVAMAWADELRGKDAAEALGFDMKRYEAARKRLLRKLEPIAAVRREL